MDQLIAAYLKHLGPGPHPSGTEQDVHGSGGGTATAPAPAGDHETAAQELIDNQETRLPNNGNRVILAPGLTLKAEALKTMTEWVEAVDSVDGIPVDVEIAFVVTEHLNVMYPSENWSGIPGMYDPWSKTLLLNVPELGVARSRKTDPAWSGVYMREDLYVIRHEIGHALHGDQVDLTKDNWRHRSFGFDGLLPSQTGPELGPTGMTYDETVEAIKAEIGEYAATNHAELVAEMYTGMSFGKRYSDDLMMLYNEFKGPPVEKN